MAVRSMDCKMGARKPGRWLNFSRRGEVRQIGRASCKAGLGRNRMNSVLNAWSLKGVFKEVCDKVPVLEETVWYLRSLSLKTKASRHMERCSTS